jgi:hypothetical protein
MTTAEQERLNQDIQRTVYWKRWGPYLSERAWGTVREDYSPDGDAWNYLPHDQARSKAFRWGEDGIAGISDRHQILCFSLALWNGQDPILKERLFGLSGPQGNHGEDVKEYYYYLDNTPTHSYMKYLYKYPQNAYPYEQLVEVNARRTKLDPEYELIDTGIFGDDRYYDVFVEYAKHDSEDILIRLTIVNRGPESAELDVLPTLWFRNTWSWRPGATPPQISKANAPSSSYLAVLADPRADKESPFDDPRWLYCESNPDLLFTENETNNERLYGVPNVHPYVKDSINDYLVQGKHEAVNPAQTGTKMAARYHLRLEPGESRTLELRLSDKAPGMWQPFDENFAATFTQRMHEADEFYAAILPDDCSDEEHRIMRQAFAGMLWSKQFYYLDMKTWLHGDPGEPPPPPQRLTGRNHDWTHLYNSDIISMPDKWEYPWYAAWDLGFHCVTFAMIDPAYAKELLVLFLREWYMHPNGQIPAYEWAFDDVNPPVHAWAAYTVYKIDQAMSGQGDRHFLESVFQKLLLNFTWWVNRKDAEGQNVFQGGFLGLDNIGVFDRNQALPNGMYLEQSDGTSWMAMYSLNMLTIALELAQENSAYSDIASKFFEHFIYIAHAMNDKTADGIELWSEEDGFYYDVLHSDGMRIPLKVRSMVGLIPLFAISILESDLIDRLPSFRKRMQWFIDNWEDIYQHIEVTQDENHNQHMLLSLVNRERMPRVLRYMLDESEFLSEYGLRSLSRYHKDHPYSLQIDGTIHMVDYEPAESTSGLFGGNSNWRGPIWFPPNYLVIQSLNNFSHFYGDSLKVEFPTGSGNMLTLDEVANELSDRLKHIFERDAQGRRAVHGGVEKFQNDPHWRDLLLFYEYFHGDNGAGIGASHQTGWTGLIANLLYRRELYNRHALSNTAPAQTQQNGQKEQTGVKAV